MRRYALRDNQWDRIKDIVPGRGGSIGVTAKDNRLFIEAVYIVTELGFLSAIYLNALVISELSICVTRDGANQVYGKRFLKCCLKTWITNMR